MTEPSDAYAPPHDPAPQLSLTAVLAAWLLAGASAGTAVGGTLSLVGRVPDLVPVALAAAALAACAGGVAWEWERRRKAGGPTVLDGRGQLRTPMGVWLLAVPLALGVAGLSALVMVGTVHTGSVAVGAAFAAIAVGFATLFRPLWVAHLLTRAAVAAESGDVRRARAMWMRVASSRLATRSGRDQAALSLGLVALQAGELEQAARWYGSVQAGRAGAFAAAGEALVRVLQGDLDGAEASMARATAGGLALQSEVDAVRILLVLRRHGPEAARDLGERLLAPDSNVLFLGVLAVARREAGDPDGADALLRGGLADVLRGSTVVHRVPELQSLIE